MKKEEKKYDWYIGIDEVGRGPLAGPITICAAAFKTRKPELLKGIKDSKKLSAKQREGWLEKIKYAQKDGDILFCVSSSDHKQIDTWGLTKAVQNAIEKGLKKLDLRPDRCLVLLDGGLHAPSEYIYQETIIKGDEKEGIIAAASIIAKIDRDGFMCEQALLYPEFGFNEHKGYGTQAHYAAIKKHGPCEIHRRLFLKKLVKPKVK